MKLNLLKKIGVSVLVLLIVAYFAAMLFKGNINTKSMVDTELATIYTYNETITAESYIVRNETLLSYDGSKVLYYTVNDGDIVAVGSEVALVFANESDALNYNKVNELYKQIDTLDSLNTSYENVKADFSAVDKQIELNLRNIISSVNNNNSEDIISYGDNLIFSVNQRQIITGTVSDFNEKISELNSEVNKYKKAGSDYSDVITTDKSGYFVASADGFENVFNYDSVTDMTVDDFSKNYKAEPVSENTIGKIVSGLNWYVVCKLSADDALTLSHSNVSISLTFPNTTCSQIPAKLVSLNQASKQSEGVAVFKCNYMNTPISHLRHETVQITVNSFEGIRINKAAIHDDYIEYKDSDSDEILRKKVQGVYVLHGSELIFKEISIIYAGEDFVIVDDEPEDGKLLTDKTVELNDQIVVRGEDLYNGKIVE